MATAAATPNRNSNRNAIYRMMPIIAIAIAFTASRWSFAPTVGPISVVLSMTNEFEANPLRNTSTSRSAVFS